jgi:tetratricopeptide (TPR) repeat protein
MWLMNEATLDERYAALRDRLDRSDSGEAIFASEIDGFADFAIDANAEDRADLSIALLSRLTSFVPKSALTWQLLALAYREEQRLEESLAAMTRAAAISPDSPKIALGLAQVSFETGRPAAQLFRQAQRLAPSDLAITRAASASLAAEGNPVGAISLMRKAVGAHPDWIDGHATLATLLATSGDRDAVARSYIEACQRQPQNLSLRLAWFHVTAMARDWDSARAIIDDGEKLLGEKSALTIAKIYVASESGAVTNDPALFDPVAAIKDPGLDLCHIRYLLRTDEPGKAAAIGSRHIGTPMETTFWPYLSLAWRLLGDPRAQWLDGDPPYIKTFDLGFTPSELDALAETLRALHTMRAPYLEQSVRGGTQTDRPLFFRHDPAIQNAKARVIEAIRDYVAGLPPADPAHPLLGVPRDRILFEGSWSVRLAAQGFHVCHTHTRGWISSALYVSIPETRAMGPAPAGWIAFGTPPPDLGLDLEPYARIEPKPGRLVLFPSTMWHGTVPFDDGERLTIAFDVKSRRQSPSL